jgi:hypothetical protein
MGGALLPTKPKFEGKRHVFDLQNGIFFSLREASLVLDLSFTKTRGTSIEVIMIGVPSCVTHNKQYDNIFGVVVRGGF